MLHSSASRLLFFLSPRIPLGSESESSGYLAHSVFRIIVGWWIGFCLIRQPSPTPIVCFHQSQQLPVTTKSFESITLTKGTCDAFSRKNQTSWGDWVHFTLASRNSDSDFAPDLSAARLHIRILGAVASAKTRVTPTISNPHT